jgi:pimeloyl-ACP methyl ester carboxylesterase
VLDLLAWLARLDMPVRLFGWSYGGLIAIEAATRTAAVRHAIAYEPVVAPFGATAVPALRAAISAGDLARAVAPGDRPTPEPRGGHSVERATPPRRGPHNMIELAVRMAPPGRCEASRRGRPGNADHPR